MKVKERFLRNNSMSLIFGLDLFYVITFYIFLLINFDLPLNLNSVIDVTANHIALIMILIHPFLLIILLYLNSLKINSYMGETRSLLESQENKMEQVYQFVEQLREGATNITFAESIQQDKLVRSIQNLSHELEKTRKEEEFRKKEEQQRHWTNEGLATFGKILRENVDDLEKLSSEITSNLTKYLNSQQAGFFVIKEEEGERIFEMISLFAFDRKKFPDKKFKWGEGLIGACAIEQKTIFLKETSDSFVDITSGLGKANPRSILIVPIKDNEDTVHGVLELASFKIYEDYEVNFVEQVAESIGLTMASIKTNLRTQELLKESQKQAEMLAQQEETMRRNIEEIEMEKEQTEEKFYSIQNFATSINETFLHIEINKEGKITHINDKILQTLKYENVEQIENQDFVMILPQSERDWFTKVFNEMVENKHNETIELKFIDADSKISPMLCYFLPVISNNNELEKISMISINLSEKERIIAEEKQKIVAISGLTYRADLKTDGKFIFISDSFIEKTGYDKSQIDELEIYDLLKESEKEQFKVIWSNILKGRKFRSKGKFVTKTNDEIDLDFLFSPLFDFNNNISKIDFIAVDITEQETARKELKEFTQKSEEFENKITEVTKNASLEVQRAKEDFNEKLNVLNLYEQLFSNIKNAIILIQNDKIVMFNSLAEELWGFKKDIVIGKRINFIFPDIQDENQSFYLKNLLNTEIADKQCYIKDKESNTKEVFATVSLFKDDDYSYISIMAKPLI